MAYKELVNKLFKKGKEKLEDMEVYVERSKNINIGVFNGEIDKYSIAESGGLSLRGISNGKMGYSYTEKIDESSIEMLIDEAYENGKYIDSLDPEKILAGSVDYEEIDGFSKALEDYPIEKKIEFTKFLEKEALSLDKRITSVQMCIYQEFDMSKDIINTKGVNLSHRINGAGAYISVIAREGVDVKTGLGFKMFKNFADVDYKEIAKEAVDDAISSLGAKTIKSDDYPTVIDNYIFAGLLDAFSSIFSAESVQKGLSLFKDKVGEKVGSEKLTIVDNPYLKDGFASISFDDEGTKTIKKNIIDQGVLTTYLHNWKTANKDGEKSTGNAKRSSYKSSIDIGASNFYVEKGEKSFEDILSTIEDGVYITELAGLHSGLNPISGDFSLPANGFKINNGKLDEPIHQIIVSGNFFQMLKDIEEIGNDLKVGGPMSMNFGSPSVKIKKLSISGE
ncbi:MAG TPA: TldD/PmbA family protein [Tissierellaceae bacterium]|nr:TldD/PmbA family protein [Tissierellaceae bacterium]